MTTSPNPQGLPNPGQAAGDIPQSSHVLRQLENTNSLETLSGQSEILISDNQLLAAENLQPDINVSQRMLGYIQAGDEVFSLIEATDHNSDIHNTRTFLTRLTQSGESRPKLYAAVTGDELTVGRGDDNSLTDSVSRKHFGIRLVKGGVQVRDLDSTNKTKLLRGNQLVDPTSSAEVPVGKEVSADSLITGIFKKSSDAVQADASQLAELAKFENWSVKSADIRSEFDAMAEAEKGEESRVYPHAPTEKIDDPLGYELGLLDKFEAKYGHDGKVILGEILNDVKRYAGFDIPKYKVSDKDFDAGNPDHDELGYFRQGSYEDAVFTKQFLTMPKKISQEEYDAMSQEDQAVFSVRNDGVSILGPIPERVLETINEVYKLTGARVIVDDRAAGEPDGSVVYQGVYEGKPIFFKEDYRLGRPGYLKGLDYFGFELISQRSAEFEAKKPAETELRRFMDAAGIQERRKAYKMIDDGELTRDNVKDQIALFEQFK